MAAEAAPVAVTRSTPVDDLPELIQVAEAAAWLGVSQGLVRELARRGELPSVRLGRLLRLTRDGLRGFVAAGGAR